MQDYDAALKLLLRKSGKLAIRKITGLDIQRWMNVEVPKSRSMRLDLLGEAIDGTLVHIELQTTNDREMHLRMAEYCLGVRRLYGRIPRQYCLYMGTGRLRMPTELRGPGLRFKYSLIDARTLDGSELIESPELGDNLIVILARLRDHEDAVRRIAAKTVNLSRLDRKAAFEQLLLIAELRQLGEVVEQEANKMPFTIDLKKSPLFRRLYNTGVEEGRMEGRKQGIRQGLKQGELRVLRAQIEQRFGLLPLWALECLNEKSSAELKKIALRVLKAKSLETLLK